MSDQCRAYSESRSVPTARGGRRYMQCRHKATRTVVVTAPRDGSYTCTAEVCGLHGKMHDEGRDVFISQWRRS
jgi:hypothetical protein